MASSQFHKCMQFILSVEGGYVNNPKDPGGETNYGISKRAYPNEDIKNLKLPRVLEIYEKDYWDSKWDKWSFPIALCMMDTAVNMGPGVAQKLYKLSGDNYVLYIQNRINEYKQLIEKNPKLQVFWNGWMNRLTQLRRYIEVEK